jgi:hypoxanthine-DNA glycosylase
MIEHVVHPFQPVYNSECTMLVLGTIPSPVSREVEFYYGHPRNRFWQVLSAVFDEPLPYSIVDKTGMVLKHNIALWDVLAACDIKGADDNSISKPEANDFSAILAETNITKIFTTGEKAYKLYNTLVKKKTAIEAIKVPSTSPANTNHFPINTLIDYYMVLKTGKVFKE